MAKLVPLLREGADELEQLLLESAREDAPPDATARARTIEAVKAASRGAAIVGGGAAGWKIFKLFAFGASHWAIVGTVGLGVAVAIGSAVVLADRPLMPATVVAAPTQVSPAAQPHTAVARRAASSPTAAPSTPEPLVPAASPGVSRPDLSHAGPTSAANSPHLEVPPTPSRPPTAIAETETSARASVPRSIDTPPRAGLSAAQGGPRPAPATPAPATSTGTASAPPAASSGTGAVAPGPSATGAAPSTSAVSLRQESIQLESVREALAASQIGHALSLLDAYDAEFPSGALDEEATVLRVEALVASGRRDDAREVARGFEQKHPASSYLPRLRALLERKP